MKSTIDHVTNAVRRAYIYGEGELRRYFAMHMDDAARLKFDGHLVQLGHPLAYQAGTCESRFIAFCKPMVSKPSGRIMTRERQHALAFGTPSGQAMLGGTKFNQIQDTRDYIVMIAMTQDRALGFTPARTVEMIEHLLDQWVKG